MVRLPALQTALTGLVGFNPHYSPTFPQYTEELLESRSGLYINAIQLITPDNLTMALPRATANMYPVYDAGKEYKRNAIVRVDDALYISSRIAQAGEHPVDGGPWVATDVLSARLRFVMDAAVAELINKMVAANKINGGKSIVEATRLYHGAGSINDRVVKMGRFVGYEIVAKQVRDFAVAIRAIGIQSDTPNPTLKIYIYHPSTSEPIKVLTPNFEGSGTFSWAPVADALLLLEDGTHAAGGSFFVGYYENDVAGQMIEREQAWPDYNLCYSQMMAAYTCARCNPDNQRAVETWSKNLEVHPFTVAAAELNEERTLWNVYQNVYNYSSNYGLNLDITLGCDLTQFIIRNEMLLADALHKMATVKVLEIFTTTVEQNPTAEIAKLAAAYNLDNKENHSKGLKSELEKSLAALALDVVDGDSPCAPVGGTTKVFEVTTGAV